jgi:hypothetical protein
VTPLQFQKERKSKKVDSRLLISGMTAGEIVTPECFYHPFVVTPEWFYQGSTVFKSFWIPDKRFRE